MNSARAECTYIIIAITDAAAARYYNFVPKKLRIYIVREGKKIRIFFFFFADKTDISRLTRKTRVRYTAAYHRTVIDRNILYTRVYYT